MSIENILLVDVARDFKKFEMSLMCTMVYLRQEFCAFFKSVFPLSIKLGKDDVSK